jgi:hypothetical protein
MSIVRAIRAFRAQLRDDIVDIAQGELVIDSHEVVATFPQHFAPVPDERAAAPNVHASGRRVRSRPKHTAEQQCAIRAARLAELEERERQRSAPPSAEDAFWRGVDELLASVYPEIRRQRAEDAEGMRLLDELETVEARRLRGEREDLSAWLDR